MSIIIKHHDYNLNIARSAKNLGGHWDSSQKLFVFENTLAKEKILALKEKWEGETVVVDIKAARDLEEYRSNLTFAGYTLAFCGGRDSGSKLNVAHVQMLAGKISSGGSMKNWYATCKEGTIFRLKIAKHLLKKAFDSARWDVALASENKFDAETEEHEDFI